jgi:LPXTG-motif cell wall-anchored protein
VTPASTPNFLPILGLILIVGGIFIAIVRRRLSNR